MSTDNYNICNNFFRKEKSMFYDKLEKITKEKQLTMNKLSKEAGFSQASTDRWKKGSLPNTDALLKICKYLNVSADYLLDLEEEAPPPVLTDQEKELIEAFRECDSGTQRSILISTKSIAADQKEKETSFHTKNVG
jgi:transcriptional regulator with XRE-family HTH domain